MPKTLAEQLGCARREVQRRKFGYRKAVDEQRMSREQAQYEIDCMDEIVATLEKLKLLEEVSQEILHGAGGSGEGK